MNFTGITDGRICVNVSPSPLITGAISSPSRAMQHGLLDEQEGEGMKQKSEIQVNCPCCGKRLFDVEPENGMGNEVIKIKCNRCRGVAAIKLKKYVLSK